MESGLKAVVIGAGWAGEGHTKAMQSVGVEVTSICARQEELVRKVADSLGVKGASTDWKATMKEERPDIVCIGTPASLRLEVVETAVELGCHILCDKPLAATAEVAGKMYRLASGAGLKHAYASTFRYDPVYLWAQELLEQGVIGAIQEISRVARWIEMPFAPWSWMMSLEQGGGMLNNGLSHHLGVVERLTGGKISKVMGNSRGNLDSAPVVPGIHDFRDWNKTIGTLSPAETKDLEWRAVDVDLSFATSILIDTGDAEIFGTFSFGMGHTESTEQNGLCIYGESGTMIIGGPGSDSVTVLRPGEEDTEEHEVPQRLKDVLPAGDDGVQRRWNALVRDFVADIRDEAHEPYLTFEDGYRYQAAFDVIRASAWTKLPA